MNKQSKAAVFKVEFAGKVEYIVVFGAKSMRHAKAVAEDQGYEVGKAESFGMSPVMIAPGFGVTELIAYDLEY